MAGFREEEIIKEVRCFFLLATSSMNVYFSRTKKGSQQPAAMHTPSHPKNHLNTPSQICLIMLLLATSAKRMGAAAGALGLRWVARFGRAGGDCLLLKAEAELYVMCLTRQASKHTSALACVCLVQKLRSLNFQNQFFLNNNKIHVHKRIS